MLLTRGADYLLESTTGWTCLHAAASSNNDRAVKAILSHGNVEKPRLVNMTDKNKRTALHIAAFMSNEEMVRILLQYGADPELKDLKGSTAYTLAAKAGRKTAKETLTGSPEQVAARVGRRNTLDLLESLTK